MKELPNDSLLQESDKAAERERILTKASDILVGGGTASPGNPADRAAEIVRLLSSLEAGEALR